MVARGVAGASPTPRASEALDAGPRHGFMGHLSQGIECLSVVGSAHGAAMRSAGNHLFEGGNVTRRQVAHVGRRCSFRSYDMSQRKALLTGLGTEVRVNALERLRPTLVIRHGVGALMRFFKVTQLSHLKRIFEVDKWWHMQVRDTQQLAMGGKREWERSVAGRHLPRDAQGVDCTPHAWG